MFLSHPKYLNVMHIHNLYVNVKALWTSLGKLFLLYLYMLKTHLKSFDYKAMVSIKWSFI